MTKDEKPYDYGRCDACGAPVEERVRDQTYRVRSGWVLVRSIPTGVCVRCGWGVIRAPVLKRVMKALGRRTAKTMRIRVVELASA